MFIVHHPIVSVALVVVAWVAGTIDTIAGGGGLITVPAFIAAGLSPAMTLGTNKLQACFGSGMATRQFMRFGNMRWTDVWPGMVCCLVGASLGTLGVLLIHPTFLKKVIPILLIVVLVYSLLSKRLRHAHDYPARLSKGWFFVIFGLLLGAYDGFFGPGTGSFWVIALVFFLGFNLQKATMHAKIYNFVSNVVSLVWFMTGGHVIYSLGLAMAIGQLCGAKLGARLVMRGGVAFIRPLFIVMVVGMVVLMLVMSS